MPESYHFYCRLGSKSFSSGDIFQFCETSLLPAAASDAAAVAIHGSERGMAKMGRSVNWKLDDRKLSRRKFLSCRNEKFRDVNFPSRTTESCPNVNRPSRTRRVVKMRIFCQKFILRIEVRCRINRILWVERSDWRTEKMRKRKKKTEKFQKLKKAKKKNWLGPEKSWKYLKKAEKS